MELKYPKVTLKRIQDVWDKLGGEDGVDKFLNGEIVFQQVQQIILRCISDGTDLIIPACDGSENLADASDVFKSYIDPNFKKWGLGKSIKPTGKTPVKVCEMVRDSDFKTMFTYLSADWEKLCITEQQIKLFCKDYPDWLTTGSGGITFFLTKRDWEKTATIDNLFVAGVRVYSGGLRVFALRFEEDCVWGADGRHRLVVPQLET